MATATFQRITRSRSHETPLNLLANAAATATAAADSGPQTIDFLADENHQGFKVRYDKEKGLLSVFDLGQGISRMNLKRTREAFSRIKNNYPETATCGFSKIKFNDSRQETWACDVTTAIELCQLWPGKAAAEFRRSCAVTIRRVLAGDATLIPEILDNSLRTDSVSQLMQEANGGPSRRQRQRAVDPLRSEAWYGTRELRSKPFHIQRSEKMKETFPGLTTHDFCQWNKKVGESVTGLSPKEFSEKTGAPKRNRRDYYNTWGLATQTWLDSTAMGFMESGKMQNFEDYKEQFNEIADMIKNFGEKNKLFEHLPEKPTRQVLTAREALAENNAIENPAKRRVTDRIYH